MTIARRGRREKPWVKDHTRIFVRRGDSATGGQGFMDLVVVPESFELVSSSGGPLGIWEPQGLDLLLLAVCFAFGPWASGAGGDPSGKLRTGPSALAHPPKPPEERPPIGRGSEDPGQIRDGGEPFQRQRSRSCTRTTRTGAGTFFPEADPSADQPAGLFEAGCCFRAGALCGFLPLRPLRPSASREASFCQLKATE